ncbi:MAG: SufD family Fe-S cluster assembly protein [Ruminococcus sp.]|nr:SufD family Fe-S cluster assembly protein [Ruminococcus sp.]
MTKLNKLPAPTYGWLGVNYAERELSDNKAELVSVSEGSLVKADITSDARYELSAQENKELTVIMYISDEDKRVDVSAKAESGSKLTVVQVFDKGARTAAQLTADIADSAELRLIQLYIGGADTVSEINPVLSGYSSSFKADIGYLLEGEDKLDINLIADHKGRKSISEINVSGVLADTSDKTFKGTIDFKNGASGAKGAEKEDVLLLSEKVRNKTVPLILCAEEDVEGSHGASIGRINEEHIFYMQSRGIPEDKIYELTARSKTDRIIKLIGDEETVSRINKTLGRSDDDE